MGKEAKRVRDVAESSKRRARMKKEKAKAKAKAKSEGQGRPDWLPEGWIVKVRAGQSGRKVKHYTSPGSGLTCCSKQEVLRYLEVKNVGDNVAATSFSEHNKSTVVAQAINLPEWLPHGWILEIKTRLSGARSGKNYMCYFDPVSGSRLCSKAEVLRFLKSGNHYAPTSGEKKRLKASTTDNVLAQIEYSPDGLPPGWIKEIIFRKSDSNNKATRNRGDPYYTDPVSGYVFRSLTDAVRYVKTGELSKYAFGPRKRSLFEKYSLEKESPPPISVKELKPLGSTTKRHLFTKEASASNGEWLMEMDESPDKLWLPPPDHALSENFQKADPTSSPDAEHVEGKVNKKRRQVLDVGTDSSMNAFKHGEQKAKRGRPSIKTTRLPVESEGMVVENDESPDKLHLPPDLASSASFQKTDATSSPDIPHKGKADQTGSKGSEATTDALLNTSKHGEQKAKRSRPTKESISEKENTESEELLEPTVVVEKSSEPTNEITPASQDRKQKRSKAKSLTLPRRSSKRLAGLEPAPATDLVICRPSCPPTDLVICRPSCPPISNGVCNRIEESVTLAEPDMDTGVETYQLLSNGVCNRIEESVTLAEPEMMDTGVETYQPLFNGVCNKIEESVTLAEPEMMDYGEETYQPLSNGVCNSIEESVTLAEPEESITLAEPEMTVTGVETYQPLSNGACNRIEESVTLAEAEMMDAGVETYQPLSNGACNRIEESVTLVEPEMMDAWVETYQPLSIGVCNRIEESVSLAEPEMMDAGVETYQPLSNGACNRIEESVTLAEPEMMDSGEETYQPLSTGVCNRIEESVTLAEPEESVTLAEPEMMAVGVETYQPLSNGVCNRIEESVTFAEPEESVTLAKPEMIAAGVETYQPLSNGVCNRIEEFVTLAEPEVIDVGVETYQPLSNGACNRIEESVTLAEPEMMDTGVETYQPLSNGTCKQIEESAPLPEPERMDGAEETSRSLSTGACNGTEESVHLAKLERMDTAEELSRPLSNGMCNEIKESVPLTEPERIGTAEAASLGGQVLLTGQTSEDRLSSPFSLPFSDAWSDPCIEFAVKTLMGEIPVLDEGLAIEEYIQKQLSSVETSNPSAPPTAVASDIQGLNPAKLLGLVEQPKKQHLPVNDEGKPFPSENGLPSGAGASKVQG